MFDIPIFELSTKARPGFSQMLAEFTATFGLLLIVLRRSGTKPDVVPWTVASWITAAYWFTASTSFANPAVTVARAFTDTFAGIAYPDVSIFLLGQFVGTAAAALLDRMFGPGTQPASV
jgi:glycerol uptake facilitator-like aquaporin